MVYCSQCGSKNKEKAEYCSKCGTALYLMKSKEKREDTCFGQPEKRVEEECSGFPHLGAIAGIIIGVFIILFGLTIALGIEIGRWIGPFILIIIGFLIIIGVIFSLFRRERR